MSKRLMILAAVTALATSAIAFVVAWLKNRRLGASFVTNVVDPLLVRRGLVGGAHSEIGILEHAGRKSGLTRTTPVRPVPTQDGFRIVVPLAGESQWAQNVLAAGHCKLTWQGVTYELDEPRLVSPDDCPDLAAPVRLLASALDFRYMRLHRFTPVPQENEPVSFEEQPEPALITGSAIG